MKVARRTVFGAAAAAAVAAVVPSAAIAAVGSADRKRLADMLARGATIDGEHFEFFDGKPVVLGGVQAFELRNTRFTWHGKKPKGYLAFARQNTGQVENCLFEHAGGSERPMTIRKI